MGVQQKRKIRRGETLWSIAREVYGRGSDWKRIAAASKIKDPRRVRAGTMLTIPMAAAMMGGDIDRDPGMSGMDRSPLAAKMMPRGIDRVGGDTDIDRTPMAAQMMPQGIERAGRGGDTEMGHLTPGEVVLPRSILQDPAVMGVIEEAFRRQGIDFGRYKVGGADDSINPETGAREYYDSSFEGGGAGNQDQSISDPGPPSGGENAPNAGFDQPAAPEAPAAPEVPVAPEGGTPMPPDRADWFTDWFTDPGVMSGVRNDPSWPSLEQGVEQPQGPEPERIGGPRGPLLQDLPPDMRVNPQTGKIEVQDKVGNWRGTWYTSDDVSRSLNPSGLLNQIAQGGLAGIYGGIGTADPYAAMSAINAIQQYRPISGFEDANFNTIVGGMGKFINTLSSQAGINFDALAKARADNGLGGLPIGAAPKGIGMLANAIMEGKLPFGDVASGEFAEPYGMPEGWSREPNNYFTPGALAQGINDSQATRSESMSPGRAESINQVLRSLVNPPRSAPPGSLGLDSGGLTGLQQRAQIATYGTQGSGSQYRDIETQRYYRDLLTNLLQGGAVGLDQLLPIEMQYLTQVMGVPAPSSSQQLLESIARV